MQDSDCNEINELMGMIAKGTPLSEIERTFHSIMNPKELHIELMNAGVDC